MKVTLVVTLAILLSSCTTYWTRDPGKGGFTKTEFNHDMARCEKGFIGGPIGLHGWTYYESQKNEYVYRCLQAMGYRRISQDEAEWLEDAK